MRPTTKTKRRKLLLIKQQSPNHACAFDSLSDDILHLILEIIGKKSFLNFSSINKRCNTLFATTLGLPKLTFYGYITTKLAEDLFSKYDKDTNSVCEYSDENSTDLDSTEEEWKEEKLKEVFEGIAWAVSNDNHLLLLDWSIRKNNLYLLGRICSFASRRKDRIHILERVFDNIDEEVLLFLQRNQRLCNESAKHGVLNVLKWLKDRGCYCLGADTMCAASEGCNIEILKYLRKNNCEWNSWSCSAAASTGNLEILKWLRKEGCPWDQTTCGYAAREGHLDLLKWARSNGCEWSEWVFSKAAQCGDIEILEWLLREGCPWSRNACATAAEFGHLNVLKWLRDNGCEWCKMTCICAAAEGNLAVLQWARLNGCEWSSSVCSRAAEGGHLEILKYARTEGCPWNDDCIPAAIDGGHQHVVQWMRDNGCPESSGDFTLFTDDSEDY